jgi:hypothetical protein
MTYFSVVISTLSLGVEISIGASGNCKDCAMSWKSFILLLGFLDLWRRWKWWVSFGFDLRFCVVLHRPRLDCGTARGYVISGPEGILSVELVKIVDDWVWHNGRIDNMPKVGFGWLDKLVLDGVINFSRCWFIRRFCGILLHFSL